MYVFSSFQLLRASKNEQSIPIRENMPLEIVIHAFTRAEFSSAIYIFLSTGRGIILTTEGRGKLFFTDEFRYVLACSRQQKSEKMEEGLKEMGRMAGTRLPV